ncbi:hypothetical protein D3C73_1049150 [compost metagenome]
MPAFCDATRRDDRQATAQLRRQHFHGVGALVANRCAGQTARLVTMLHAFDAHAAQGGVGGDDRVHAGFDQRLRNLRGFFVGHVRSDLDRQRHVFAVTQRQFRTACGQVGQQLLERIAELQAAQARRVRRADVDRDVAGMGVDLVQADQVIVDRTLDWRIEILADVDAQHALVLGRCDASQQVIDAEVVEAHAIDDRLGFRQTEQARLRVARLRTWRDGADFDKTETQLGETIDGRAVLVQAGGQPHRIREVQAHDIHRRLRRGLAQQAVEPKTPARADQVQGQIVGGFRGKFEQQLTGQGVHGRI